ncbi:kinesin-like protein KIN-UB isoform X2 [Tanacetum coccineum]
MKRHIRNINYKRKSCRYKADYDNELYVLFWLEANQRTDNGSRGISLLSMIAADVVDPQTLRMVVGAIFNLCGNGN